MLDHFSNIFLKQSSSQPLAFLIAFLITYSLTPLIRERALKLKIGSRQDQHSLKHQEDIPRLGGIGILISIILTVIFYISVFGRYTPHGIEHLKIEAIAVGGLIIFFVGLLDDIKPLNAELKLLGQVIAGFITWLMGIRIEFLANPTHLFNNTGPEIFKLDDVSSLLATLIFLLAITNAINLIDGIDGLAVGVCLISSLASWAINLSPVLNRPDSAIFAATMAGSCFAFLRYNFNPARIFLGDNGAYLLGFALACISCIGLTKQATVVSISPIILLVFLVPLLDFIFTICRRLIQGKKVMKADLEHFHHRLLKKGLSQKQINYLIYFLSFVGASIATWTLGSDIFTEYLFITLSVLLLWFLIP